MRFLHRKAFVLAGAFVLLAWTAAARAQYLQPGQQPYVQPAPGQYVQPGASPYAQPAPGTYVQPAAPMVVGNEEVSIVESATQVLNEIMAAPAQAIPVALLHDAKGIIICPGMLKGGFVIGVKHGRGVLVVRDDNGNWRAPSFISITGGSIGWQIGIQATDVILVFKTKKSIQGLINGKFTIGGDVSAAAGPVGRDASASTDLQFRAEIYSYSRSRGLFAGAALDGSQVSMDNAATAAYYRGTGILQPDLAAGQAAANAAVSVAVADDDCHLFRGGTDGCRRRYYRNCSACGGGAAGNCHGPIAGRLGSDSGTVGRFIAAAGGARGS